MQIDVSANLTNGSATVTVPNADLTPDVHANYIFLVPGEDVPYWLAADPTYSSVDKQTTFNLSANYAGTTGTKDAVIVVDYTTPDSIPLINAGDVGTATIFSRAMTRIQQLLLVVSPSGLGQVAGYADLARAWASDDVGVQPDATNYPGKYSAYAYSVQANTSATNAATSETNAATHATDAATSATNAATSATNASNSATTAGTHETNAATSATNANNSATAASSSATLAHDWANDAVGVVVDPTNHPGEYSAYHWAQQSKASVVNTLVNRGPWDASSGSYPAGAQSGDFYRVSVAGTTGGVNYGVGDSIYYDGGAWERIGASFSHDDVISALGYTPLDQATYTAADILAKLETVDGTTSGLDSDLLDGQHGAYYADIAARLGFTPLNKAGDSLTGELSMGAGGVINGIHKRYRDTYQTIAAAASPTTTDLDLATDNNWLVNLDANATINLTNVPAEPNTIFYVYLYLKQDATGGRTITFTQTVHWDNNTAPTWSTAANKMDTAVLWTMDEGTTWYGGQGWFGMG